MSVALPVLGAAAIPAELEGHEPAEYRGVPRDHVQLLISERLSGNVGHAMFVDLGAYLREGDLLVVNDSATLPAALDARTTRGEAATLHLSAPIGGSLWVVEPRSQVAPGETLLLPSGGEATLIAPTHAGTSRMWYARVDVPEPIVEYLYANGRAIRYRYVPNDVPIEAYQTMFARVPGSVEMPSAGRPFTPRVSADLERRGIRFASLTLHCGVSSAESHEPPQPERFAVPPHVADAVNAARREGRRVIAVGTTVVRALESAVRGDRVIASQGWTDLVVTPERGVVVVDGLLTGLHEPAASHLDMLRAFLPADALREAYDEAVAHRYLWHEFGDVHLIV
jgi:S-adenosylmethionine:tRNA ribosyltransferase-isomerase